jgi:ABC-type uncharacterized transport system involved in gliding motility auxiliary subunit
MAWIARSSRYWLGLTVSIGLLVAILGVVQVIAERHNVRLDLTPSRRLSLSDTTRQILARLEDDVRVTAYYRREARQEAADLLARFAQASPRVRTELRDIDRYPQRARAAGIHHPERALVSYGGRRSVVSTASEEYLAGGILRVLRGKSRRIYFLAGHGERVAADPTSPTAYGRLAMALKTENAEVAGLELIRAQVIPADADAVVIAGPAHDLLPEELAALDVYLARGGALLALLDPGPLPRLGAFLARYNVRLGDDVIVDRTNRILGAEDLVVKVPYYRMHPVTAPSDAAALLAAARTVDAAGTAAGAEAQTVARASEEAWATAEIEAARRGEAAYRAGRDRAGPLPVMVAVSLAGPGGSAQGGRLVVVGDADFAANGYVDLLGNRDLLLNSLSWLTDEEALIARRPREVAEIARPLSPLVLTERQAHGLFLVTVVLEPGLLVAAGSAIVLVRRRRG